MLAAAAISARATRLITRDVITAPLRRWVRHRVDKQPEVVDDLPPIDADNENDDEIVTVTIADHTKDRKGPAETFVSCAWCIGWWISLIVFAVVYILWPGHDWSGTQLVVWLSAAAAVNTVHGTIASTTEAINDVTRARAASAGAERSWQE